MNNKKKEPELPEKIEILHTRPDWGKVRGVFKKERYYISELLSSVSKSIEEIPEALQDTDMEVILNKVWIGLVPEEPDSEVAGAITYLKVSFLKFLESEGVIRDLKIGIESIKEDTEFDSFTYDYIAANFVITGRIYSFIKQVTELIDLYIEYSDKKIKTNLDRKILILKGSIHWGEDEMFTEGYAVLFSELYRRRSIVRKGIEVKKGNPITIKEITDAGTYKDEKSFRSAINKMRKTLLDICHGQIKIESSLDNLRIPSKHYLLVTYDI